MTPLLFLGVVIAGGVGAGLRYVFDLALTRLWGARLPWGILVVNLTGACALGALSAGIADATGAAAGSVTWVIGVGLLGGYTTFSSVAVTTALLAEERRSRAAVVYGAGTFAGSVAAALLGGVLGALIA